MSENGMSQTKRVFSRTSFLNFALVEAPTNFNYNSLKAECCSGENVLAVLSAGFLKTTKVLECFRTVYKIKTAAINFLARLLGSPRSCS